MSEYDLSLLFCPRCEADLFNSKLRLFLQHGRVCVRCPECQHRFSIMREFLADLGRPKVEIETVLDGEPVVLVHDLAAEKQGEPLADRTNSLLYKHF